MFVFGPFVEQLFKYTYIKNSIVSYVHLARTPFNSSVHKTLNDRTLPDKRNTAARNSCSIHVTQTLR